MPSKKLNLRDRVEDNQLDLSMSDLDEVPVREIAQIKMATFLDLSNNRLTSLGANFASLIHLVKLDLSKNQLTELPSNFGDLVLLKHLDLYSNKIQHLPLSLGQLSNLRWLDLKDNPLVPALAEVVGPCLDTAQCQKAARAVVPFMQVMKEKVDAEREFRSAQRKRQKELDELAAREEKKKQQKQQKKNKKKAEKQQQKEKASKGENGVRHQVAVDELETLLPERSRSKTSDVEVESNPKLRGKSSRVVPLLKLLAWITLLSLFTLSTLSLVDQRQYKKLQALVNRSVPCEVLWKAVDVVAPRLAAVADTARRCQLWLTSEETTGNLQAAWDGLQAKLVEWYRTLSDEVPRYYEVVRKKAADLF